MKKKLFTLLLCAFAWIGVNAYTVTDNGDGTVTIDGGSYTATSVTDTHGDTHYVITGVNDAGLPESFKADEMALINNATTLKITGYVNDMKAFQNLSADNNITTVDMSGAVFQQSSASSEEVTYYKYDPTSKKSSQVAKTYYKNVMAFYYFKKLSKAVLPTQYLESICFKTFDANMSLTTTFTIPSSVKYIATQAVINTPITSIDIPATVEYINYQGFQNASIAALIAVKGMAILLLHKVHSTKWQL